MMQKNFFSYQLSHRAPLYFLFFSLPCQIIGMATAYLVGKLVSHFLFLMIVHSLVAFGLARWLRLSLVWQLFNLLLVPAIVLYKALALPPALPLVAFALAVLMYLPTFWTRVPYFPTSHKMYDAIAKQLPSTGHFSFIDLGCGFGALLSYLSERRPQGVFEGVEISPLPFLLARVRLLFNRSANITIRLKNFWSIPLKNYDFVYAFLAPGPMPYLWQKAKSEMKPGAVFITNTFPVEAKPYQTIKVDDSRQGVLYIHKM